jgi:hypothetical protein
MNSNFDINNNLLSKCIESTKLDGSLDFSIYIKYKKPYKKAFKDAANYLPNNCVNVTYPNSANYDNARKMLYLNTEDEQYPNAVYKVFSEKEISNFLTIFNKIDYSQDKPNITVTGQRHAYRGDSSRMNTIMIDVSEMFEVTVNTEDKTVKVQPGSTSMNTKLIVSQYGLKIMSTLGENTGSGAFQFGYHDSVRKYGAAMDNILSVRVVIANGKVLVASKKKNKKLFFAILGTKGGSYGIITEYTLKAYVDSGTTFFAYAWFPDPVKYTSMGKIFQNITLDPLLPNDVSVLLVTNSYGLYGNPIVNTLGGTCQGNSTYCRDILSKYFSNLPFGVFILIDYLNMPYFNGWFALFSGCNSNVNPYQLPNGKWTCEDTFNSIRYILAPALYFKEPFSDEVFYNISLLVSQFTSSDYVEISIGPMNGEIWNVNPKDSAMWYRDQNFIIQLTLAVPNNATRMNEIQALALNKFLTLVEPYTKLNNIWKAFVSSTVDFGYNKETYCIMFNRENCKKLKIIKQIYDPNNFFNYEQSIPLYISD